MDEQPVNQDVCEEKHKSISEKLDELKLSIDRLLARTEGLVNVKLSLETLWTEFKAHERGHWKWVAVSFSVLTLLGVLILIGERVLKATHGQ